MRKVEVLKGFWGGGTERNPSTTCTVRTTTADNQQPTIRLNFPSVLLAQQFGLRRVARRKCQAMTLESRAIEEFPHGFVGAIRGKEASTAAPNAARKCRTTSRLRRYRQRSVRHVRGWREPVRKVVRVVEPIHETRMEIPASRGAVQSTQAEVRYGVGGERRRKGKGGRRCWRVVRDEMNDAAWVEEVVSCEGLWTDGKSGVCLPAWPLCAAPLRRLSRVLRCQCRQFRRVERRLVRVSLRVGRCAPPTHPFLSTHRLFVGKDVRWLYGGWRASSTYLRCRYVGWRRASPSLCS